MCSGVRPACAPYRLAVWATASAMLLLCSRAINSKGRLAPATRAGGQGRRREETPATVCQGSCTAVGQLRHAWTEAESSLGFKVKAEGVNLPKLAGGVLVRCDRQLETFLEPMGARSVYNCIKALIMVNRFIRERDHDLEGDADASRRSHPRLSRVGFVPLFARKDQDQWMRLLVVDLKDALLVAPPGAALEPRMLKVSANTALTSLSMAIVANWRHSCDGSAGDPRIAAMGVESVSKAVKGTALANLALRNSGDNRKFLVFPWMEKVPGTEARPEEPQTVTFLGLEKLLPRAKVSRPSR